MLIIVCLNNIPLSGFRAPGPSFEGLGALNYLWGKGFHMLDPYYVLTRFQEYFKKYCVKHGMDENRKRLLILLDVEIEKLKKRN